MSLHSQAASIPIPRRLDHAAASFLLSLFSVIVSALVGYGGAVLFFPPDSGLVLSSADPYAGCQLAIEYVVRAATLCRPILLQTAILWFSAYVHFEKSLLAAVFALRGLSLGIALHAIFVVADASFFSLLPLVYAAITAVFLVLTRYIRKEDGVLPMSESCVYALMAGGIASVILLIASLFC